MVSSVKKIGKYVGAIKSASKQLLGKDLSRAVSGRAVSAVTPAPAMASPASFAKGGKVKRTGLAKVHKGEKVFTAKQLASMKKMFA
jgi:hypothetical protein